MSFTFIEEFWGEERFDRLSELNSSKFHPGNKILLGSLPAGRQIWSVNRDGFVVSDVDTGELLLNGRVPFSANRFTWCRSGENDNVVGISPGGALCNLEGLVLADKDEYDFDCYFPFKDGAVTRRGQEFVWLRPDQEPVVIATVDPELDSPVGPDYQFVEAHGLSGLFEARGGRKGREVVSFLKNGTTQSWFLDRDGKERPMGDWGVGQRGIFASFENVGGLISWFPFNRDLPHRDLRVPAGWSSFQTHFRGLMLQYDSEIWLYCWEEPPE